MASSSFETKSLENLLIHERHFSDFKCELAREKYDARVPTKKKKIRVLVFSPDNVLLSY